MEITFRKILKILKLPLLRAQEVLDKKKLLAILSAAKFAYQAVNLLAQAIGAFWKRAHIYLLTAKNRSPDASARLRSRYETPTVPGFVFMLKNGEIRYDFNVSSRTKNLLD